MTETILLLDGDDLAHRWVSAGDLPAEEKEAHARIRKRIEEWESLLEADEVVFGYSDGDNFRKHIFPSYRSRGDQYARTPAFLAIQKFLKEEFPCYQKPALEARDILGILSTSSTLIQGHTIVVSGDSSLHMVPGWFYDPERHASGETMFINKIDADLAFYRRVLEGDADNQVPGCPGMNPETTGRLLSAFKDDEALWLDENWTWHRHVWEAVVEAFRKAGQSESEALLQARLIRVLREPDYSWDTEEVHLWAPSAALE